ncbi:MAG: flagellar assembly protein FliW [Helicobacteraceae bacterium]|nr:flagellar assembly protein FliW [Helicobacteraceae bacterium]
MNFEIVSPIMGFEDIKTLELKKIDEIFATLIAPNGISWSLVNPYVLREYKIALPFHSQILLDFRKDSSFEVYCMMIIQHPLELSKVNFLAPLIFNLTNKRALQVYFNANDYPDFVKLESLKHFSK